MKSKHQIKLLFNAEILISGLQSGACRSGIFFASYNILKELIKNKDIDLTLYVNFKLYKHLKLNLKRLIDIDFYNINLITDASLIFIDLYYKFRKLKDSARDNNYYLKKIFYHYMLFFVSIILKVSFYLKYLCNCKYRNYDVYFSPFKKFPKNIIKVKNIQKCLVLYDCIPILYPQYYASYGKKFWFNKLVKSLNHDDTYFAISESTRQDFIKNCPKIDPNKIHTTLLACDEKFVPCDNDMIQKARAKYNIPLDKRYVFSLCTLEPRKNLIRAVKTFVEFIKKNNIEDMVFVLGGGQWDNFIKQLEKELGSLGEYKDKIIKAGYVADEDLAPLYSGAEWFVYTSQYEGFGMPPLEAMSSGCPVITSNNSSLPEVVGDAGIMIDWDSDQQHIDAYEKYYFNTELREQYRQKGLERSKQFTWKKCVDKMVEVMLNDK